MANTSRAVVVPSMKDIVHVPGWTESISRRAYTHFSSTPSWRVVVGVRGCECHTVPPSPFVSDSTATAPVSYNPLHSRALSPLKQTAQSSTRPSRSHGAEQHPRAAAEGTAPPGGRAQRHCARLQNHCFIELCALPLHATRSRLSPRGYTVGAELSDSCLLQIFIFFFFLRFFRLLSS